MPEHLKFGQIVWAEIADANGVRKSRPAIITTPDERITASGTVDVVAITSRLLNLLPPDHVLLPWHAQRHPRTGLSRKSAAVCSWVSRISVSEITEVIGLLSGAVLLEVLARIPSSSPPADDET